MRPHGLAIFVCAVACSSSHVNPPGPGGSAGSSSTGGSSFAGQGVGAANAGGDAPDGGAGGKRSAGGGGSAGAAGFADVLGAAYDASGEDVRFAVYSARATRIEVDLFASAFGADPKARIALGREPAGGIWSVVVSGSALRNSGLTGDLYYGFRAWGPNWDYDAAWTQGSSVGFHGDVDANGNRFNPNKLLIDPYTRELSHDPMTAQSLDGKSYSSGEAERGIDTAKIAPKSVVLREDAPLASARPTRPFKDDIVYEVHVRGFTESDPSVTADARGTYRGAAQKAAYLRDLGVTALELLPIQETQNDSNDWAASQMSTNDMNYWGYATLAYFAPDRRYSSDKTVGGPTREFKAMVEALHTVGIKVLLDVVYNHTGEGGIALGDATIAPLLSFRGLDNASYYELSKDNQGVFDSTGTSGNFNTANLAVRNLILDSLQYWKGVMGVDGFRFDLAPVLGNSCTNSCFTYAKGDAGNALNRAVKELPVRPPAGGDGVDLIAEPWALGDGTYQLGNFPNGFSEWNGSFRDTLRIAQNKLSVTPSTPAQISARLSGSPDLFQEAARAPSSSVNYIASHDGFTLRDVYAYATKNNAEPWPFGPSSGGDDENYSWDQGSDLAAQRRAALTGLSLTLLSIGVPMITGGDEWYRTQYGNNNPYNLDSDKNWLDWSLAGSEVTFSAFARNLCHFRLAHAALRPAQYLDGKDHDGDGVKNIAWLGANGTELTSDALGDPTEHFLAYRLDGSEGGDSATSICVAYNASDATVSFSLPSAKTWLVAGDSSAGTFAASGEEATIAGGAYAVGARSVVVLLER